jgi:cell division protein FtsQ
MRRLLLLAVFAGGVAIAAGAAHVYNAVPLRAVVVDGAVNADTVDVLRLAGLPDSAAMVDVDARLVADRIQRHPWIRAAHVRRLPTGTLHIDIIERSPVALVVDAGGRPDRYLDADGYELPVSAGAGFDVPLLRGRIPVAANTRAVDDGNLVELLRALGGVTPEVDALISELHYNPPEVWLRTTPVTGHSSLSVRLGTGGYADKLERLRAFYDQAVLTRPGRPFQVIDLRFDGQVVTRESESPAPGTTHNPPSPIPPPP